MEEDEAPIFSMKKEGKSVAGTSVEKRSKGDSEGRAGKGA